MTLLEIAGLPEPVGMVLLVAALIVVMVVAYKVLEMVFDVAIVAVISGVFYTVLTYIFATPFSFNDLLLFTVLGAALYLAYTTLYTAFKAGTALAKIPIKVISAIWGGLKKIIEKLRSGNDQDSSSENDNSDSSDGKSRKEVILES